MPSSIDAACLARVFAHAKESYPRECCGYLHQSKDGQWSCVPCENQQDKLHALDPEQYPRDARTAYHIGGKELLNLVRSFDSETPVRVIYHSHPEGGAYFSSTDTKAALAAGYPVDYLVVDAQGGTPTLAKLFRQRDQTFEQIADFSAQPETA